MLTDWPLENLPPALHIIGPPLTILEPCLKIEFTPKVQVAHLDPKKGEGTETKSVVIVVALGPIVNLPLKELWKKMPP